MKFKVSAIANPEIRIMAKGLFVWVPDRHKIQVVTQVDLQGILLLKYEEGAVFQFSQYWGIQI